MEMLIHFPPLFAAAGFSMVYLLGEVALSVRPRFSLPRRC